MTAAELKADLLSVANVLNLAGQFLPEPAGASAKLAAAFLTSLSQNDLVLGVAASLLSGGYQSFIDFLAKVLALFQGKTLAEAHEKVDSLSVS